MRKFFLALLIVLCAAPSLAAINVISGNLTHRQEIFAANGGPMSLKFFLNYGSFDQLGGQLGAGWGHNYNIYLYENSVGTIVFTGGATKHFYFPVATGKNKGSYVPRIGDFSTLVKNANGTWAVTLRNGLVYRFGTDRKLTSITDRYGNAVTLDRTVTGQTTITDPAGRSIILRNNAAGKIVSITDPALGSYDLAYHPNSGLLWTLTFPAPETGAVRPVYEYLYTAQGLLEYRKDPEGHITKYVYDTQGRVVRTIDPGGVIDTLGAENPEGHIKMLQYNFPTSGQTTVTEKDGGVWVYSFDATEGVLTGKMDPKGAEIHYSYYPQGHAYYGLKHQKIEPVVADTVYVTTFVSYDSFGNNLESTGYARHFSTDQSGQTVVTDDPVDMHRLYAYDNANGDRLTSITDLMAQPDAVTTFVYDTDPEGLERLTVTDPAGKQTFYRFNGNGSLKDISGSYGTISSHLYHPNGDLLSVTDASGVKTEFLNYDGMGNPWLVKVIGTDGSVQETLLGYDALSRLKTITRQGVVLASGAAPVDLLTLYGYDKVDNRVTVDDAEGNRTVYDYNYKGMVTTITDAHLKQTELIYSGTGCGSCGSGVDKLIGVIDANHAGGDPETAKKTGFGYYPDGNLQSETDPLGNRILYAYYAGGMLKEKRFDSNGDGGLDVGDQLLLSFTYYPDRKLQSKTDHITGQSTSFTYWSEGWLKTAIGLHIGYTFEYYPNGWLKKVTDSNGRVISYDAYDSLGQRDLVTLLPGTADQRILDYGYDTKGRLQTIASAAGTFTFGYDAFGRRGSLTYPNRIAGTYAYHPQTDSLTGISYADGTAPPVAEVQYPVHDKIGNRKERKEDGVSTIYGYDNLYQLLSANTGSEAENFTYDPVGNRKSGPTVKDTELTAYEHDDANRMLQGRKYTYEYDKFGNQRFRYLSADKAKFWEYTWNGDNRMIKAELKNAGVVLRTVSFKYDPLGRRIEKKVADAKGTVTRTYVYDSLDIVLEYVNNGAVTTLTHYVHGPGIDEPLAIVRGGYNYFFHADGLGSIIAITDANKNVVQRYIYDSFGMFTPQDPGFESGYAFTGREWDKEIGLYFYRARYFDSMEGRFVSRDPIGFDGGDVNWYGYVQNNPVNRTDEYGLRPSGVSFFRWWAMRICIGTITGIPLTVGAGIDLLTPNETALDPYDSAIKYPDLQIEEVPPCSTYDPISDLWIPPTTPTMCMPR